MSFNLNYWARGTSSANDNASIEFRYLSTTDDSATIATANYFDDMASSLKIGDEIYVTATDGAGYYTVTAVSPHVTVSALATIGAGGVGTANLADGAVTTAKLDPQTIQYVKVAMTAAEFNGMYASPFQLVAAPGAGKLIRVHDCALSMTFVAAQYAAGGAVGLQYDSTAHGAGTAASATVAAATVNAYAASSVVGLDGDLASGAATACLNKGLYISNATAAFTTGDGTWEVHVWYSVVTA